MKQGEGSPPDAFHVKQELERGAASLGLDLAGEQLDRLARFAELLSTRAIEIGAIAASDRERVVERHILDSLRAAPEIRDDDRIAYDFGSGAGLPGIPLAVVRPACAFALVESRHWRAAFLELVVSELELNVRVERARVEKMGVQADLAVSRAFAPLAKTWGLAEPLLRPGGRLVFFAGRSMEDPEAVARAAAGEGSEVRLVPDQLDRGGPLVIIGRSD